MRWFLLFALAFAPDMKDEMLAAHNAVRAKAGVKPLVWSDKLAAAAQEWADKLMSEHRFYHPAHSPYGQNLYEVTNGEYSPEQIVKGWAAEEKSYDYRTNKCRGTCGHYTQLVWADTKEVGCAMARRHSGEAAQEIWVCEYYPPGNYVGQRPY